MRDGRVRVLVVLASLGQGGAERFTYEVLKAIDRTKFDVHLLTRRKPSLNYYHDKIEALGIPIHHKIPVFLHYLRRFVRPLYGLKPFRALFEAAHRVAARIFMGGLLDQFDVIEAIQIEYYYLIEPLVENNDKILINLMSHAYQYDVNPYLDCRPDRRYRFMIYDWQQERDYEVPNCANHESTFLPFVIDVGASPDLGRHARLNAPFKIGVFQRLHRERPIVGIFRAFKRLLADGVDAQLAVYGRGDRAQFDETLEELGIKEHVIFPGHSSSIARALEEDGLSLVWMTSHNAVLGYGSIEIASYGYPMFFWNLCDASSERIRELTGGAIHTHADPDELAAETAEFMREPQRAREVGEAVRRHIFNTYDAHKNIGILERKLLEIAAANRRG